MTKYEIYIRPDEKIDKGLYISGKKSLYVLVSEIVPYDKLSKRFNKYTHEIEYKEKTYVPKDYILYIYDPNAWIYKYILSYYYPSRQIKSIDVFFPSNDKENKNPLVFGFNYDDDDETVYYTYYHLRSAKSPYHSIPSEGSFDINDLLSRLLEELGLYTKINKDKLVIETDRRPTKDSPITYPKTGPNKLKITVRRSYDHSFYDFAKFTHSIKPSDISGFYISYNNNTIFVDLNNEFKRLNYFNVYYKIFDSTKPVLFELKFQKGTKIYGFSQFENDLKNSKLTKKIGELNKLNENKIYEELKTENDRVHNYVTYSIEKKTEYSYQINVSVNKYFQSNSQFINYTHRPYTQYTDKKSKLFFNGSKLLKWKTFGHLTELYDSRSVTFESVDVYFGTRNTKFPLIVKLTKKGQSSNNPDFFVHKQSSAIYYWEQLHVRSQIITHEILISKLKKTEFALVKPIVLLLDKKANYTYSDIVYGVGRSESARDFHLAEVDSNGIKAEDKTGTLGKCISDKGYRVVEHDLSSFSKLDGDLALRFYTLNSKGNRYTEIILHSSDQNPSDAHEDYIYFDKKHKSVYVYFYSDHITPLLICYGNTAYKPFSSEYYSKKWVKVHTLTNHLCNDPQVTDNGKLLLSTLENIAKSLNLTSSSRPSEPQTRTPISTSVTPSIHTLPKPFVVNQTTQPTYAETRDKGTVEIDLSKNFNTNYGPSSNITVTKNEYTNSNLFCYYTHSLKDESTFTLSSFLTDNGKKKSAIINNPIKLVQSVNAYFNTYYMKNPIILGLTVSNNETIYYANIVQVQQSYDFSSFKLVDKEDLTQTLIDESDRINKTLTYQLDKTFNSDKTNTYGYDHEIKITKNVKTSDRFTVYTHEPNPKRQTARNFFLFNQKLVDTRKSGVKAESLNIQNKPYKNITIYSLNNDTKFPLIMVLNDSQNKATYFCRMDGSGQYWLNRSINLSADDKKIELELFSVFYPLKNSVIIQIDKKDPNKKDKFNYPMKIISNNRVSHNKYVKNKFADAEPFFSETIEVSDPNYPLDRGVKGQRLFYYVSHQLEEPPSALIDKKNVAGVRFFMTNIGTTQPEEIYFYEKATNVNDSKGPLSFYYPPQSSSSKIFVFFYDDDPRPLLVSYDGHTYKRINLENDTQWVRVGKANYSDFSDELKIIKEIYKTMKKKITLLKDGEKDANIRVKKDNLLNNFVKHSYSVEFDYKKEDASLKLPIKELVEGNLSGTSLDKLLENLYSQSFDSINVYKTSDGSSLKNILVFEFINGPVKTHISRKDQDGKFWVRNTISGNINAELSKIQSEITNSVVYDISKRDIYDNKIKFDSFSKNPAEGFTKYTHSPKDGLAKLSFILYQNEELKIKQRDKIVPLSEIENKRLINISVYYGNKAKEKQTSLETIPLVIELFNGGSGEDSRTYYSHKRNSKSIYWELNRFVFGGDTEKNILYLLKQTEFDFLESIIILTDLTNKYGEDMMNSAIAKLNISSEIIIAGIDDNSIKVEEKYSTCLNGTGFKYREYNIERIKENVWYGLRFFVQTSKSNIYSELTLNNSANHYKEYLYHKRDDSNYKVYVFFYEDDPRPLMVCYRKKAYRPMRLNEYFDRWYRDSSVLECCQEYNVNYELIKALSNVVGFLNEVQLDKRPYNTDQKQPKKDGSESETYNLQTFNDQTIKVRVTYSNMNCYRAYKHEPIGLGSDGSGFRLGNIKYNDSRFGNLEYDLTKQLKVVTVYYSLFDTGHRYPLLVILQFSGNSDKQFFGLNDHRDIKWQTISENIQDSNIEYTIKQIVDKLGVSLDKSEHAQTLFDRKECHEDSKNATIIGATSSTLGTMATVGTGVGVTAAVHPEWFIPVIRALV